MGGNAKKSQNAEPASFPGFQVRRWPLDPLIPRHSRYQLLSDGFQTQVSKEKGRQTDQKGQKEDQWLCYWKKGSEDLALLEFTMAEYTSLGVFDAIIMGTGLVESILAA